MFSKQANQANNDESTKPGLEEAAILKAERKILKCRSQYVLAKHFLNDEFEKCLRASPDKKEECAQTKVKQHDLFKALRNECMERQVLQLAEGLAEADAAKKSSSKRSFV